MTRDEIDDRLTLHLLWAGIALLVIFLLVALTGCNTAKALETAPMEFWSTLGTVFKALLDDLLSILW